jgi:hypothetical protein
MALDFVRACMNFSRKVPVKHSIVFRKVAFDLYAELVKRSPVDTGLFRGNWRIGVNYAPSEPTDRKNKSRSSRYGAEEVSKIPKVIRRNTAVYIVNNLVYALLLERGSSVQAPRGIVQPSMQAIVAALQGR